MPARKAGSRHHDCDSPDSLPTKANEALAPSAITAEMPRTTSSTPQGSELRSTG